MLTCKDVQQNYLLSIEVDFLFTYVQIFTKYQLFLGHEYDGKNQL